jgi:hypothetical protein
MEFDEIVGVDFSGAKLAGLNAWVARVAVESDAERFGRVTELKRLGDLAGDDNRAAALAHLVAIILGSRRTLWGMDFPFALPVEVVPTMATLRDQLEWVAAYHDDAYAFGRECVATAQTLGSAMHIRRDTDRETKTPFDCYHYRIICQTFYGMRNVIRPLRRSRRTIIPPFDKMRAFDRAVVESCPGSTLKRWGVPHNNYKQPAGGPLEPKRIRNRRIILDRLRQYVTLDDRFVRIIQRNPGGDALDAVIAAVGAWQAWRTTDFKAVAKHPRYRREGRIFS